MPQPGTRKPLVFLLSILAWSLFTPCSAWADAPFVRADVNSDGQVGLADATAGLDLLFLGQEIPCIASADANDDESIDVSDSVYILLYLFLGQAEPPPPFSSCGLDPTPGELGCEAFPACGLSTEFVSADGQLTITVPEQALPPGVQLEITEATNFPAADIIGSVYDVGPDGTVFSEPVTFLVSYAGHDTPEPDRLRVATVEAGEWVSTLR